MTPHREAIKGMAWTVDEAKAKWFAHRFGDHDGRLPYLATGIVKKKHVLASFVGRGESEVVILSRNVRNRTVDLLL